ncbi:hypothetical protein V8E54_010892 [Elaphomyces granulatus]
MPMPADASHPAHTMPTSTPSAESNTNAPESPSAKNGCRADRDVRYRIQSDSDVALQMVDLAADEAGCAAEFVDFEAVKWQKKKKKKRWSWSSKTSLHSTPISTAFFPTTSSSSSIPVQPAVAVRRERTPMIGTLRGQRLGKNLRT